MAVTAGVPLEDIEFSHLDNDLVDEFFFNLMHLPAQFSKRFSGKMTMGQVLEYSKRLKKREDVAGLDEPTKKNLMDITSANTLNGKYIIKMNNFLDHAVATGKMEKNWLAGREIKSKEVIVKRRVFSKEELKVIFSEKMFTEKNCYKNEYSRFWLPILSLYTGARINEVAQLRVCDFKKETDIYYINITESEHTSVKTKSSIRKIPLHPDLVKIGFVKYCEWMSNKNEMFLFPELHGLDQLKPGEKASRAFSTFFKNLGIAKETEDGKATFHSFRHTFADFLIQNYLHNTHKCALMGHSFSNTTDKQYGDGVSLQTKYEDIVKCIDLKNHSFPWNNEKYFQTKRFPWE